MADEVLQIRSYRVVFDLERRIHRIDRFRVPLPYGLPLRSVGYAAAALMAVLIAQRIPILGTALGAIATPIRLVLLPIGASVLLSRLRIDGRPAHAAALAWVRFTAAPNRYVALRPARAHERVALGDLTLARPQDSRPAGGLPGRAQRPEPMAGEQLTLVACEQLGMW